MIRLAIGEFITFTGVREPKIRVNSGSVRGKNSVIFGSFRAAGFAHKNYVVNRSMTLPF